MTYFDKMYNVSDIIFLVHISENYANDVMYFMSKSLCDVSADLQGDDFIYYNEIYYIIEENELKRKLSYLERGILAEGVFYFRDCLCYRICKNNTLFIKDSLNEWVIEYKSSTDFIVYVSDQNPNYPIYLLRFMRSLVQGIYADKGFVVMHSAAVSIGNRGMMIIGEKGSGKTTLLIHFLNCCADIISNDRTLVDRKRNLLSFSQPLRIGSGTFEHTKKMVTYLESNSLYRKQGDMRQIDFKYLVTMDEICKIFNVKYIRKEKLDCILVPEIQIGENLLEIRYLDEKEKEKIFEEVCFTPIDESYRSEWIYKPSTDFFFKIESRKIIWNELKKLDFIKIVYGTEVSSSILVNKILEAIIKG